MYIYRMEDFFKIVLTKKGNYVVRGLNSKYLATLCVESREYRISGQLKHFPAAVQCEENLPPIAHIEGTPDDARKKVMELANIKKLAYVPKKPKSKIYPSKKI